MRKLLCTLAAVALVALFAGNAVASSHNSGPSSKANFTYADINIAQVIDIVALDVWVEIASDGIGDDDGICEGAIFGNEGDSFEDEFALGGCDQLGQMDALARSKWVVLQTQLKMPKHKDISIDVSMECGNFLETKVRSKGGDKDSASAASTVRVAVLVDDGTGTRAALPSGNSVLAGSLTADGNADGDFDTLSSDDNFLNVLASGVVFCHKSQLLEATFQGLIQDGDPFFPYELTEENTGAIVTVDDDEGLVGTLWEDLENCQLAGDADGGDAGTNTCTERTDLEVIGTCLVQLEDGGIVLITDCLTPEELRLVTGSMTANAFNFLYHNAGRSSVHTITVIAWLDTGAALGGTTLGNANAKAAIGMGSMMVETVRLVKGIDADLLSPSPTCVDITGDTAVITGGSC